MANRAFMQRAVRFLAGEAGIRQFIDIGTGIPAAGNVHEVAGQAAPDARVVYVDNDHSKSSCSHMELSRPQARACASARAGATLASSSRLPEANTGAEPP
jgi:hypothetical protein